MMRPPLVGIVTALLVAAVLVRVTPLVAAVRVPTGETARDFVQEYMLGRAVLLGVNPYLSQPQLAAQVFTPAVGAVLNHPVPHPPLVALLSTPLARLSYPVASLMWLALSLVCAALTVTLVGRGRGASTATTALVFALFLLWPPLMNELVYGQLNLPLATLLTGAWLAERSGRSRLAGGLLAVAAALKLYPAVMAAVFLLQRRRQAVLWFVVVFGLLALATTAALGWDTMAAYLAAGLPATQQYLVEEGNLTLTGAVLRTTLGSAQLAPLVDLGRWSYLLAAAVLVSVAVRGAYLVRHSPSWDLAYALGLCLMLLLQPLGWLLYLSVTLLALWLLWERGAYRTVLIALILASITPGPLGDLGLWLVQVRGGDAASYPLPALAGLPLLLQTAAPLILAWAVGREIRTEIGSEA